MLRSLAFVVVGVTFGVIVVSWRMYRKSKERPVNKTFRPVGKISQIFVYPIKSCSSVPVKSAKCTPLGLKSGSMRDRVFMLITADGNFVTSRQHFKLVTVQPSFSGDFMLVDAPKRNTLKIDLTSFRDIPPTSCVTCKVWGHPVDGFDCGYEAATWFQEFLDKPGVRLVHFNMDLKPKQLQHHKRFGDLFNDRDISAYADLSAYMMMNESSVEDLNTRLDEPVGVENFRPNIVLRDAGKYEEDCWRVIKTEHGVQFRNVKPCQRCILTTVDPKTGIKKSDEPLKTLRSYRQAKDLYWKEVLRDSPLLGINLCVDKVGTISVGDTVYAY